MKKRTKIIITLGVVGCFIAAGLIFSHKKAQATPNRPPLLVKESPVEVADLPIIATATGTLVANNQTNISPKVAGYVTKIAFSPGDFVTAGSVLIQLDNQKQKNDLAAAKADVELSELQYQRDALALKKGLILQTTVYSDKVSLDKDKALAQTDQTALQDMTLRAPFSGYLGAKQFSLGDYVTPGQKLVTLVDQQKLKVVYDLPNHFAPQLQIGQPVTVTADFLPGQRFNGKVNYVAPYVNSDSQTIETQALLNNKNGALKPGQFVTVSQTLETLKKAILIPENSLFANMNGHYVFKVKNGKAISTPVKVGERLYGKVQIIDGLKPGDHIITTGQDQIYKSGAKVKVVH
ncbi:efflux RND transporter periplasmic adaptor subunit [Coxiella burnetii]|uniref:Acriflavin resistance periplasmic protein n=1 Tax=Coxiella burnetii (strain RSA 493 / Nine Mile phase I) TaxID=227377 RepID=Q83DH7_COXBU|nr:efflux RND transporter periplasmic adaptor subunit [Coxiella burnetii]NP_819780.1 acriflavin resistance protein [Coxiella burnetii RSA 493]AAO90294.1 acriflavin resistance periplasmic protein [Coxiella burnetii RSA 493]ARI65592.1 MexH family multidrug efflux RND transporter periplasmic adaptor subunit [Coxiella burnetii]ARK27070.1 efflux transporter periplasmic adaptor subunit [Coxiella burnetii]MCF2093665.1 efflux RND transporter periplasmic adaptor subunit [Coxiella burnetii]MCF2094781.1